MLRAVPIYIFGWVFISRTDDAATHSLGEQNAKLMTSTESSPLRVAATIKIHTKVIFFSSSRIELVWLYQKREKLLRVTFFVFFSVRNEKKGKLLVCVVNILEIWGHSIVFQYPRKRPSAIPPNASMVRFRCVPKSIFHDQREIDEISRRASFEAIKIFE